MNGQPAGLRLTLDGISAGYGAVTVLRDLSLVVPAGRTVALLGPNGTGKTTLLRVATGLLRPSSGRIQLGDRDVTNWSATALATAGVCHIPEGRGIFRNLTVQENLFLQARDTDQREAVAKAIEAFSILGERLDQLAGTLSGGEQQMLAVSRAYISNPSVILLDEVSLGLAPLVVEEIFAFLDRLVARGSSVLLVEQYVTKALAVADYVYMLNRGSIVFAGEPSELDDEAVFASYLGAEVGVHT